MYCSVGVSREMFDEVEASCCWFGYEYGKVADSK